MLLPRLLFLLLLASGRCHRGSSDRAEGRGAGRSQAGPAGPAGATEQGGHAPERAGRSNLESQLRDPKHKEKFIGHLTGPLYFKPRCRRQFHRLYHNTRDCTVPAYYKRCALLLTQLAKRPHCAER